MAGSLLRTTFLCSDFDVKNLLGVTNDNDETILITYKGVVKQYNVVDRLQVRSWNTKSWHPFTCAGVRDPTTSNIVAVIKNSSITQWKEEEDDIENVKRYNFQTDIQQLVVSAGKVYVLFVSGAVEELESALKSRQENKPGFVASDEVICNFDIIESTKTAVLVVKKESNPPRLHLVDLAFGPGQTPPGHDLILEDVHLMGLRALSTSCLITFWSNGEIYSFNLEKDSMDKLPGKRHATEERVVPSKRTKILELSPTHIALIGMDREDEGGVIVLREVSFGLSLCSRKVKIYHDPPLAWMTPMGVVVAEGSSLALVGLMLQELNSATLFGVQASDAEFNTQFATEECRSWSRVKTKIPKEAQETIYSKTSSELNVLVRDLNKGGLTESLLVSNLVKVLLEKKKIRLLNETVETYSDILECSLVDILNVYLGCDNADLEGLCSYPHLDLKDFTVPGDEPEEVKSPFGAGKCHFINGVLRQTFTDSQLLPELYRISFDHALGLIQYLHFLITTGQAELEPEEGSKVPSLVQVTQWLSLLLDTKYHQLVTTSQLHIHQLLLSCFTQVNNMRLFLESMMDMEPLVQRVMEGKALNCGDKSSMVYCLERLNLSEPAVDINLSEPAVDN